MPRFFVAPEAVSEEYITVTEGDYNHIRNVLRMHIGESLTVCDGEGTDYRCEVNDYENGVCRLRILAREDSAVELPVAITLYQGLPKKDKMELIVQKAVELGAARIVPVVCKRTIVPVSIKSDYVTGALSFPHRLPQPLTSSGKYLTLRQGTSCLLPPHLLHSGIGSDRKSVV